MALTRLSVGKTIELAFSDRKVEAISEAKVLLMRDGTDLENELASRQNKPDDLSFILTRSPLGDIIVTVSKIEPTREFHGADLS